MCGDDDDLNQVDEELFNRFLKFTSKYGVKPDKQAGAIMDLGSESARTTYMEELFKAGLTRVVNDASHLQQGDHMDIIAGQALVFGRLTGFLAGQFPPESDLFHAVMSALMEGHKEAQQQLHSVSNHHHRH